MTGKAKDNDSMDDSCPVDPPDSVDTIRNNANRMYSAFQPHHPVVDNVTAHWPADLTALTREGATLTGWTGERHPLDHEAKRLPTDTATF